MVELEYWDERGELVIASVPAGNPPLIPNGGDQADVPTPDNNGIYACVTVIRRHFYAESRQIVLLGGALKERIALHGNTPRCSFETPPTNVDWSHDGHLLLQNRLAGRCV